MTPQYENNVISSFSLWLDHTILSRGLAYTNNTGYFYNTKQIYNNYYCHSTPFKQFVYDSSIPGASIITGLYLSGNYITKGQNGFQGINHQEGLAYFTNNIINSGKISGVYSIKDFNIKLTSQPDEVILFETKYQLRPKYNQTYSGLPPDVETYPVIYIKNDGGRADPFAFGGQVLSKTNVRCFVISDSQYKLDAVVSILKDRKDDVFYLFKQHEMPFDGYGTLTGEFNYNNIVTNKNDIVFIDSVECSKFNLNSLALSDLKRINSDVYAGIIDFELSKMREPYRSDS